MRASLLLLSGSAALLASPALADPRATIIPYVEVDQVLDADLTRDDVLTYTDVSAGVDATVNTARATGQISYRYERHIAESDRDVGSDYHTGLARASYRLAKPLTIEAGALFTRTRSDIRGAAPLFDDGSFANNTSQIYSVYAGPTLSTDIGPATFGAAYRFGYTKASTPNAVSLAPGAPRLDYFDESFDHAVSASLGVAPGRVLPVGITVSGGYDHEVATQLSQHYTDWFGRGDLLLPVSRTLALTAGVGYQNITINQKDAALDANGNPQLDANGRFVTNNASPRRIAYRTDGLIYDAGVVWRPSPRTSLAATVTHEYDSTAVTGNFGWQIDRSLSFAAVAYDDIETFGHQLRVGLQSLPTSFLNQNNALGNPFSGCIFGTPGQPGGGAGGCLNDVFQSISTASYRARGIDAVLSARRGANAFGVGGGFANRHLFSPRTGSGLNVYGLDDDSYFVQGFYSRTLTRRSFFDANLYANWYDSALPGSTTVFGAGGTAAYTHSFGHLGATAQAGVYTTSQEGYADQWTAQALLGARYQF